MWIRDRTGAINGYDHVSVSGERLTIHENRKAEKEVRKVNAVSYTHLDVYKRQGFLICLLSMTVPLFRNSVSSCCSLRCKVDIILKNTLNMNCLLYTSLVIGIILELATQQAHIKSHFSGYIGRNQQIGRAHV